MNRNQCILVALSVMLLFAINVTMAQAQDDAKMAKVQGTVKVLPPSGGDWRSAEAGTAIADGGKVKTGAGSEAYIVWPDGHAVKVAPLSLVTVSRSMAGESEKNEISLSNGKIFASVEKLKTNSSFSVKTPTAVAGVRGTKFSVESKAGETGATLVKPEGKIEVKKQGEKTWIPGNEGMSLGVGDTIRTGSAGSGVVAWAKGNVVVVAPLTQITLDQLGSGAGGASNLNLATGKATVKAKKLEGNASFEVRTPTAVAGVRGTKFDVAVPGGDPTKTENISAKLMDVAGKVEILRAGGLGWEPVTEGMKTETGDVIRTGSDGSCVVAWGGGNVVRIASLAKVKLDSLSATPATGDKNSNLSLSAGKVFVKAKKLDGSSSTFQVRTPTAIAGVRGTKFSVGLEGTDVNKSGAAAMLASVNGDVQVQKAGESGWTPGTKGVSLREGDTVKTGSGGSCILAWNKGNVAKVSPLSRLKVALLEKDDKTDTEKSTLNLESGKIHFQAKKLSNDNSTFVVRTPTAIAGVRGTQCSLSSSENGASAISCLDGKLAVISTGGGREVELGPKQKTSVSEGAPPAEPQPMTPGEVQEFQAVSQELSDPAFQNIEGSKSEDASSANTEVEVVEGQIAVSSDTGEEITVNQGEKTSVAEGETPAAPEEMSKEEVESFNSEAGLDNPAFETADAGGAARVAPGETTVRVAEGQLEVTSPDGEAVSISEGEKTSVSEGAPPAEPAEMSPGEMEEINSVEELDDPELLEMGSAEGEAGEESGTSIQVMEGEVTVASAAGGEIELEAGMRTSVSEGEAPAPAVEMSAQEVGSFQQETQTLDTVQSEAMEEMGSGSSDSGGEASPDSGTEVGSEPDVEVDFSDIADTVDSIIDNVETNELIQESTVEDDLGTIHTTITVEQN